MSCVRVGNIYRYICNQGAFTVIGRGLQLLRRFLLYLLFHGQLGANVPLYAGILLVLKSNCVSPAYDVSCVCLIKTYTYENNKYNGNLRWG